MLGIADRPIEEVIRVLAAHGVDAGFLVPTRTGLDKSILDAHAQLRAYLDREGIHRYDGQRQGREGKLIVRAWLLGVTEVVPSSASLYRPETKNGDPRIWISGLGSYARPGNLLAILAYRGDLYVANTSDAALLKSAADPDGPFGKLLGSINAAKAEPAQDLLRMLREVSMQGFIRSQRAGATGVGMTLETLLGIAANSRKAPDFRGIEIKASRTFAKRQRQNRITLFSKTPDWTESEFKDPVSLLQAHGYDREGRRQLYCSLAGVPNSLGLFLAVREAELHALHSHGDDADRVIQWGMEGLRRALAAKHQQTFWVKAIVRKDERGEAFHYVAAVHTRAPMVGNLDSLFELGHVQVDLLLHLMDRKPGERPRARDHGYLFKISPSDLGLLFPPSVRYELTQ